MALSENEFDTPGLHITVVQLRPFLQNFQLYYNYCAKIIKL